MSFRRGFQRVYAVLTIAWIACVLFLLPSDRLTFWDAPDDSYAARVRDTKNLENPPPQGAVLDHSNAWHEEKRRLDAEQNAKVAANAGLPPGSTIIGMINSPDPSSRLEKSEWLFGVLLIPPSSGYLLMFFVIPWIYRGFRGPD
jgi:hypothetical protein